jgi:hypothetical protein
LTSGQCILLSDVDAIAAATAVAANKASVVNFYLVVLAN